MSGAKADITWDYCVHNGISGPSQNRIYNMNQYINKRSQFNIDNNDMKIVSDQVNINEFETIYTIAFYLS